MLCPRPHCGGKLLEDDETITCLLCGRVIKYKKQDKPLDIPEELKKTKLPRGPILV